MQVSLNTRVSPEVFAQLEKYCLAKNISKARVVEEALKSFLAQRSKLEGERSKLEGEKN